MRKIYTKRVLTAVFAFTLILALSATALAADWKFQGDGTAGNPFLISTAKDLMELATIANAYRNTTEVKYYAEEAYYKLTADIDMTGYVWIPIGKSSVNIFKGDFDGAGHTIYNLTDTTLNSAPKGFFGWLEGGVHNLNLSNVNFLGVPIGTDNGIGGIAGTLYTNGVIEHVTVSGAITVLSYGRNIGGIVGVVNGPNARISNVSFNGNIVGVTFEAAFLGGIIGYVSQPGTGLTVENCFTSGTITRPGLGDPYIGKIAGGWDTMAIVDNPPTFIDCYSTMTIDAKTYMGWRGTAGIEGVPPAPVVTGLEVHYNDGAVAVKDAERLAVATLWFSAESGEPSFTSASNFTIFDTKKNGSLYGVTLGYMVAGGNGFTAANGVIVNITGATGVELKSARFVAYDENGNAGDVSYKVVKDDGTGTSGGGGIVPPVVLPVVPVNYDLNGDGIVDELDLAIALKYFMTAQVADFNNDGVVDIEDYIKLLNHFTNW